MRMGDILRTAVQNTFRSKLRTTLTVLAIFIGAFTLTITNAIGAGVSTYIDSQLGALGAEDVLTVTITSEGALGGGSEPSLYDPEAAQALGGMAGMSLTPLSEEDLATIRDIDGVIEVEPLIVLSPDFIEVPGSERYQISLNAMSAAMVADLAAGSPLGTGDTSEILLPDSYVEPLGFASAEDAVGTVATIGISDVTGVQHLVEATIVGVQNSTLVDVGAGANAALTAELDAVQRTGQVEGTPVAYSAASARIAPDLTDAQLDAVKETLTDHGFTGQTTADQIGQFQAVVSGIVGVLNAFAGIALIAAGFGIVNTLLMSVQERTREIGLMKAMGMSGAKVFALFSTEAVFIGFLGSAVGALIAITLGTAISAALANGPLSGLPGLHIMLFEPGAVLTVVLLVMAIAFLAGTLPARRAASQSPIDALRYE